jgi:hypothetical protein
VEEIQDICFKYVDELALLCRPNFLFLYCFHRVLFALMAGYLIRSGHQPRLKGMEWIRERFHRNVVMRREGGKKADDKRGDFSWSSHSVGGEDEKHVNKSCVVENLPHSLEKSGESPKRRKGSNSSDSASLNATSSEGKKSSSMFSSLQAAEFRKDHLVNAIVDDLLLPPVPLLDSPSSIDSFVCYPCYIPFQRRFLGAEGSPFGTPSQQDAMDGALSSDPPHLEVLPFHYSFYSRDNCERLKVDCDEEGLEWDDDDSADEVCNLLLLFLVLFMVICRMKIVGLMKTECLSRSRYLQRPFRRCWRLVILTVRTSSASLRLLRPIAGGAQWSALRYRLERRGEWQR